MNSFEEKVKQLSYAVYDTKIPDTHPAGLNDLLIWAHQYMEDNFLFRTIPGTTPTQDTSEHVVNSNESPITTTTVKTNLYASEDGTILTFQKSQHLLNMTAETGSILREIQAYLLSQDVAQNKHHATSTIECNASEDKALPCQISQIEDTGEFQTREGEDGGDRDRPAIAHRHSRAGSLLRCLCGCGWAYPPKKDKPTSGGQQRGIFQRIRQLFKRK